ncbi:drug resistance transporter, EmrB/QacA subfamily [Desulfosporosinus acidiphilus SJ4]|uniref:Drug resistance transporter, EmrB/QacA subfamily n=1 Tax=Desulfosporosinus acidiphilus (strain DSM 22704 / JCM 16185 / SJ4) TaxID=646529 RepID=I4DBC4_DESAJ|nr:DHA2 family efflux MFS transporter permease subunit [Desulfosporosinus acidiphilus]AFM43098.1 drug resistance transporter, EmrB/QacA subfamily [Desulfosporosinus acidiphilus SJ4]
MTEHHHQEPEGAGDASYKWLALFVVVIGTFMVMLDSSIVNIAIPKMMNVFNTDLDSIKWVLTGYTLAMGAVVPITGFLSDTFGIKRLFIAALGIFTIGSFLCGFSWSNNVMVVFRVIQAIGGGAIMPVGMSYIMMIFPVQERGKALGFWGIASMAAPAIGPTLGGYIIQYMDWRFIFYVNVPIGIFGVIFASILLKDTPLIPYKGNFDYIGLVSVVVGIVSLLYVLGEADNIDWGNIKFPLLIALGIFGLLIFVVNELTHPNPMLELRVLKIYDFTLSQFITAITMLALMGGVYVLPLFLQNLRGYTAMQTGLILFPSAIASGLMMPVSGAIFDKFGAKVVTLPGLLIVAFASYQMSLFNMNTAVSYITFIAMVRGFGLGLAMMPVNTAAMNAVPRPLYGRATALSTTIRSITQAIAITFMTTVISGSSNVNYARLSEQITPFNRTASSVIAMIKGVYMSYGLPQLDAMQNAYATLGKVIYGQAYLDAMNHAVALTVPIIFVAIFLVLLMSPKKATGHDKKDPSQAGEKVDHEPESGFAFME